MSIPPRTMDVNALPTILERKRTLRGQEKTFPCRVLDRAPDTLTVLFISDRVYTVGGLTLPAGTVTFGHFWQTEPYNVYHWLTPQGATLAYYFNLTTDTVISADELTYLDLTVDVLLRTSLPSLPAPPPAILDAAELPADLSPDLRARIAQALATVLSRASGAPAVLEGHADRLWQRLYARARR